MTENINRRDFIDRYFERPGAYEALANMRGIPNGVLNEIAENGIGLKKRGESVETLRQERNELSALLKGDDLRNSDEGKGKIKRSKDIGQQLGELEDDISCIREDYDKKISSLPNPPSDRVPLGKDARDNRVVRVNGPGKNYVFEPLLHEDILENLGLLVKGISLTGQSRFPILIGEAAVLEDALRSMFLTYHRNNERIEVNPPHIVRSDALKRTGQFPKFTDEVYHVCPGGDAADLFLIPTAEVPLTNLLAECVLKEEQLPLRLFGYSRCFRVETGSGGRDSQGLTRVHDFGKVELVDIAKPEKSWETLEQMLLEAEGILKILALDYRVIILCTGDLPASSAFTYDIETRVPDSGWREVSSCSNCLNFQSVRANIRYQGGKKEAVHTLNGSAFPTGRLTAAVIEQYQQADGSVIIPDGLRPYTNFNKIEPKRFRISTLFKH